jgi:hypothetical protein
MSLFAVPEHPGLYQCLMDLEPVPIARSRVARGLGYAQEPPVFVLDSIDRVWTDLRQVCRPMAGFRLLDGGGGPDGFRCDGRLFASGPEIAGALTPAQRLAVFVGTLGPGFEALRQAYLDWEDPLRTRVLEAVGSEWAERLADWIEREVRLLARAQGVGTSDRFSPGTHGWPAADQRRLLRLLPRDFCGVALTEPARLSPVLSVSGVIGLGRGFQRGERRGDPGRPRQSARPEPARRPDQSAESWPLQRATASRAARTGIRLG